MKNDIDKTMESLVKCRVNWLQEAAVAQAKIAAFSKPINALLRLLGEKVCVGSFSGDSLVINVRVSDMKRDIEPLLESIQDITGGEFSRSDDSMVQFGVAQREFIMSDPPIKVVADASGNDGDAKCRMVQTGEKLVPTFELRCEGEVT